MRSSSALAGFREEISRSFRIKWASGLCSPATISVQVKMISVHTNPRLTVQPPPGTHPFKFHILFFVYVSGCFKVRDRCRVHAPGELGRFYSPSRCIVVQWWRLIFLNQLHFFFPLFFFSFLSFSPTDVCSTTSQPLRCSVPCYFRGSG